MQARAALLMAAVALASPSARAAPQWTLHGPVGPGRQLATADDGSVVHLVSESYLQIDAAGTVLVSESDVSDGRQGPLDFHPAIAVGGDGSVHVVTRHGGDFDGGHEIRYRRRAPGGGWDPEVVVGTPVPRNYVVGVAVGASGRVIVSHSRNLVDVSSLMDVYEIVGASAVALGETPQGWLRADSDYRLAVSGNTLVLASGEPGPSSPFHVAFAPDIDGDVIGQWQGSHTTHDGGLPRRGGPAIHVDDGGGAHLLYGGESTLHYARYDAAGVSLGPDTEVMGGLGTWHLSYGNGAVVASADGSRVLAVALQNLDGDQTSAGSEILWAESVDGGASFGPPQSLGATTDGGEGRMRPRMARLGDTVMLLYFDPASSQIALATAAWADDEPPGGSTGGGDTGGSEGTGDATGGDPSGDGSPTGAGSGETGGATGVPLPPTAGGTGGEPTTGCGCRWDPVPLTAGPWLLVLLAVRRRR